MGTVLYYISSLVSIDSWYEIGGACVLGIGIYLAILWLLRELKKKDLMFFLNIISPKDMTRYVASELRNKENKK